MKITTIGIDLAKNVFQVHGVDEHGKAVLNKPLKREQMASFFVNLPACLIGMEACGSAHHWARKLQSMGHTVRLMAPQFVKPYVKTNKNDAADAQAICEAVTRPSMRFVPIKNVEQQGVLALHRARQGFVKARTAQANQIRGLLAEFGFIIAQGRNHIAERVPLSKSSAVHTPIDETWAICTWLSMPPGVTMRPRASVSSSPLARSWPTAAILPSLMPMSATYVSDAVATVAPLITRSYVFIVPPMRPFRRGGTSR